MVARKDATSGRGSASSPPASRHVRFSTRRRLIAAFFAVLAVSVSALALQIVGLRRMEATFTAMAEHEQQMSLVLQLEDALCEQFGHDPRLVMGDPVRLASYQAARSRALELSRILAARIDEPEAVAFLRQLRDSIADLERSFGQQVMPAVDDHPALVTVAYGVSYPPPLLLIEISVDRLFGLLQRETSSFRRELVELERATQRRTATFLAAMPLFVAAAVLYLSRSIAQPLARLSGGAAAVAGGDLDVRIQIDTPDEFGALAQEFNAMTVAVKQHQEKLVQSEKLAAIGRVAAGVAHELNNPLQVILGYLSLNRDVPDRRLATQLAATEDEVRRCMEIVEAMLEISRPPSATATSRVDLRALCDDVASRLSVVPPATRRLSVNGAASVQADAHKLRQVLFNLMKNAVEAAGPEGEVTVVITASNGVAELAVGDSGPGIPPEAMTRIFEPFFTTKPAGTGLGLALSRAIARVHGGDITLGNGQRGAVFTLRLPEAPRIGS
jgi:two-component system, NtrC family, sensor kinase